ncbi:hypothetical protein NIES2100_42270 [Calothrix sp. NIES-2100]|nr:hypothetical protein NIES2100_42270 [Calothrix sp. NIES-2100]
MLLQPMCYKMIILGINPLEITEINTDTQTQG